MNERMDNVEDSVRAHVLLAEVAAKHGARLVVFPELSLTGYARTLTSNDAIALGDARLAPLTSLAQHRGVTIVAGAPVVSAHGMHIGALTIFPNGSGMVYRKEFLHTGEDVAFVPGRDNHAMTMLGEVVGLAICADVVHPEHAAQAAKRGTTIYAAGCYVTEGGYGQFQEVLSGYATKNRMLALMANFAAPTRDFDCAGKSAIWSPTGALIARAEKHGQALVLATRRDGDWRGDVMSLD
jgi:predicted amidohydrolase